MVTVVIMRMVVSGGDGRGQTFHRCLFACRVAAARSENLADDIGPRGASDGPVLGAGVAGPEFKAWTARLAYGRHRGDHAKGDDKVGHGELHFCGGFGSELGTRKKEEEEIEIESPACNFARKDDEKKSRFNCRDVPFGRLFI